MLQTPLPSRLSVPAKHHVTGSPEATTTRVGSSATCAPWRGWHTAACVHARPRALRSVFSHCLPRAVVARGGRQEVLEYPPPGAKGLVDFLSTYPQYIGRLCRRCSGRGRHVRQWMSVGLHLERGRHQGRRNCATSSKLGKPIEALAAAHGAMPAAVIKVDDTPMHAAPPSRAPLHQRRRDLRALDLRPPSPAREKCDAYAAGCAVEPCPL
jgi:hypothetical protein